MTNIHTKQQNQFNRQQVGLKECVLEAYQKLDALEIENFISYVTDDVTYTFGKLANGLGKMNLEIALRHIVSRVIAMYHDFMYVFQTGNTIVLEVEVTCTKKDNSEATPSGIIFLKMEKGRIKVMKIFMDFAPI